MGALVAVLMADGVAIVVGVPKEAVGRVFPNMDGLYAEAAGS
jgi:hypothetical protein